jgi:hypothetical protein
MTGLLLSAWVLFPLLLLATSAGLGLLVRRLSGGAVSGVMLLPVGFGLLVAVSTLGTSITRLAPYAGAIAVVLAVIGIVLELVGMRGKRRQIPRAAIYPAISALVAFAAIGAPVVLTGTPTWTGYGRIVDTSFQMAFAQHLAEAGRSVPTHIGSSFDETIEGLTANGYPGGAQATLGAMSWVIQINVIWCYQAFLAFASAMGALALFAILRRVIPNPIFCCLGAAVAIQPNILYDYALEGGIKELTTASLILVVAAVLVEWLPARDSPPRSLLALAPPIAGALAAFSYGALPWLGLILWAAFILSFISSGSRLRTLSSWVIAGAATVVLAIPTMISSIQLFGTAKEAVTGVVEIGLGNLTQPVPEISAIGVWISNDYRFPQYAQASASHAFDILIVVLAVTGVICALWRRRWMIAAVGLAAPVALTYVVAHSGPWVELKAFTITAPMILALAFVGAGWLAASRVRRFARPVKALGWGLALAVAGAVLYGNALTYHDESLAPAARYRQEEQIGNRFAGDGRAMFPAFDEYGELLLRREDAYDLVRPDGLGVRPSVHLAPGQFLYSYDLNQFELPFVQSYRLFVLARSPATSRPPANYELAEKTSEFEVWRRVRPAGEVFLHLPLSGSPTERTPEFCRNLATSIRRAGAGARVGYVPSAPHVQLVPPLVKHPDYWPSLGPETLHAIGAGTIEGSISLPASGTYEVSMPGSVGRPLTLYVDGHRAGGVAYQERYPGQYLRLARLTLGAGTHRISLVRGNGGISPGSGDGPDTDSGVIGPLYFTLERPQNGRLIVVPAGQAAHACAARVGYEWMEVLRAPAPARLAPTSLAR